MAIRSVVKMRAVHPVLLAAAVAAVSGDAVSETRLELSPA
jgi:hypothetical protein